MSKIVNYFEQAFDELIHKVTWPTWSALQQSTLITLAGIIILTLLMLLMDSASQFTFESFYGFFK
jgi:preprotein translocase subunit SecE